MFLHAIRVKRGVAALALLSLTLTGCDRVFFGPTEPEGTPAPISIRQPGLPAPSASDTPELDSLILFGTGLLTVGGFGFKRVLLRQK